MKSALRAVIDTNIFISALHGSNICEEIIDLLKQDKFIGLISSDLRDEITKAFQKPKFVYLDNEEIKTLKWLIDEKSERVFPEEVVSVCRDLKDNMVLECAVARKANFIVTGDKDLLVLKTFKHTRIITPQKFIKQLRHL